MKKIHTVVAKVGGSLLTSSNLPQRLRDWLLAHSNDIPHTHVVLIAGGGRWADQVRGLDAHASIGAERAHWSCIELMDVTAGLLSAMLPEVFVTSSFGELGRRVETAGATIFKPRGFMERMEPHLSGTKLPANWDVTSDSIAARLAVVLAADQLVLLKSAPPPTVEDPGRTLAEWATAGYVDAFLPNLESELSAIQARPLP